MTNMLGKAIAIAATAFEGKLDKAGKPYILHCLRVMMTQSEDELMQIGILHDVPEDCVDYPIERLIKEGFSRRVTDAVDLLTHRDGESYDSYIRKIAFNKDATIIKLRDLEDNSQITRLKGLTKVDFDRMEKYHRSYTYLSKV